ncbi:transcriptional regulator [Coccidioides immitis RS]|uniref:Transcriptional regulator n=2 Tax=Coccidioides immitis TaxID=5501 RepID=A0A0E1RWE1_COCIM|nr:transcriptional regulator [Coccidioides immitis RS]EAS28951.1 transcriptional regulator [Coccidioides immitis RS]KMU87756.1 hypothetical protein CIHG_05525 [Coccidioides immitis H538.4]TPX22873.1 hypothetical protein DIZ76_014753 [Coccidioides immitis]
MSDDSESISSFSAPEDDIVENALRETVAEWYRLEKFEDLTMKRIRRAVENALNLPAEFLKRDLGWKPKSEGIIKNEVDRQDQLLDQKNKIPASPSPKRPAGSTTSTRPPLQPKRVKRASAATSEAPRKRRRQSALPSHRERVSALSNTKKPSEKESDIEEGIESGILAKRTKMEKKPRKSSRPIVESASETEIEPRNLRDRDEQPESEMCAVLNEPPRPKPQGKVIVRGKAVESTQSEEAASESEMSEVLDEAPRPQQRKRKNRPTKGKATGSSRGKDANVDKDQAEIKRLQSWLVKCGIRKMWPRELAPFDTPKAKIRHLKEMLSDAGMVGRYSIAQANVIRETKELQEDLEVIQEGAKKWGREESDDEGLNRGRPRRLATQEAKSFDFLNDDDVESG